MLAQSERVLVPFVQDFRKANKKHMTPQLESAINFACALQEHINAIETGTDSSQTWLVVSEAQKNLYYNYSEPSESAFDAGLRILLDRLSEVDPSVKTLIQNKHNENKTKSKAQD